MAKILIIGCGDIGTELGKQLVTQGHRVSGWKRTPPTESSSFEICKVDVTQLESIKRQELDFDQVVYILAPDRGGISTYEAVFARGVDYVLDAFSLRNSSASFIFVSSTRVYGQHKGEWLDEEAVTEPADERGKILLAAESKFLSFNERSTVVRFSGIYGRSNYFINQLKAGCEIQKKPPYFTNRIHRDDCVGVLSFLINKKINAANLQAVYLATDHDPAPKWDVANYLATELGLPAPVPLTLTTEADCNKRLDNDRLTSAGYRFKFKGYKDGYAEVLNEPD